MKKSILALLGIVFMALPMMVNAQAKTSSIDALYNKYAQYEGFTTVNISMEMMKLIGSFKNHADDEESKKVMEAIDNLQGMKIITLENMNHEKAVDFKKDLKKVFKSSKFVELMTVKEKDEEVKFLLRKDGDKIIELLLLVNEKNEQVAISFFGLIDLETIGMLSKNVKMGNMPDMSKLKEHLKK